MKRKVNGLCGDYNDKADDLKDPDSPSVMLTPQEFGEKWRTEQGCPPGRKTETRNVKPTLGQSWATVVDGGPVLIQHWIGLFVFDKSFVTCVCAPKFRCADN